MKIQPSILTQSSFEFIDQLDKLSFYYQYFQIDIADGVLVPNTTISLEELLNIFTKIKPRPELVFDLHLMVEDYLGSIKLVKQISELATIKNVLFHHKVLKSQENLEIVKKKLTKKIAVGIVLNPEDTVNTIRKFYDYMNLPSVQIMSVHPGFQGKDFIEDSLIKIEQLRTSNYRYTIFLDGGVTDKTLPMINALKYRPDYVSVGGFLSKSTNLQHSVEVLNAVAD